MKYLRNFFESDSWAGSLLAYDKRSGVKPEKIFTDKVRIDYICNSCGFEFYVYNPVECCNVCQSSEIKKVFNHED